MGLTNFGKAKPKHMTQVVQYICKAHINININYIFILVRFRPIRCMNAYHQNPIFRFQEMGNRNQTELKPNRNFEHNSTVFGLLFQCFDFSHTPTFHNGPSPNQMPKSVIWEREREIERDRERFSKLTNKKRTTLNLGQNKNDP